MKKFVLIEKDLTAGLYYGEFQKIKKPKGEGVAIVKLRLVNQLLGKREQVHKLCEIKINKKLGCYTINVIGGE